MTRSIIHTTVEKLAGELSPFAGDRRVEVRVIDATAEEENARVKLAVARALDDPRPGIPAETVFDEARARIEAGKAARYKRRQ